MAPCQMLQLERCDWHPTARTTVVIVKGWLVKTVLQRWHRDPNPSNDAQSAAQRATTRPPHHRHGTHPEEVRAHLQPHRRSYSRSDEQQTGYQLRLRHHLLCRDLHLHPHRRRALWTACSATKPSSPLLARCWRPPREMPPQALTAPRMAHSVCRMSLCASRCGVMTHCAPQASRPVTPVHHSACC